MSTTQENTFIAVMMIASFGPMILFIILDIIDDYTNGKGY